MKEEAPAKEPERVREERKAVVRSEEEIAEIKAEAERFLTGVFKAMELPVEIKMQYKEAEGNLDIEFVGEDMGILIGKRGQTLDSTPVPYKSGSQQRQTGIYPCEAGYRKTTETEEKKRWKILQEALPTR